jgi:cytoskeletal protein CcmA (bactofilin family)
MFNKLKPNARSVSMERFETLIGPGTTVHGDLMLIDSVRIDGRVMGNIESAPDCKIAVAIGPTGEVTGDIKAHRVMVAGKVFGHIHAVDRVEFQKDSCVQGDISYGSIAVEHGAKLSGLIIQNKTLDVSASGAQAAIQSAQSTQNTR